MTETHTPDLIADLNAVLAQLRHGYQQLVCGLVDSPKAFADGLIKPQIIKLEKLQAAALARPVPAVAPECAYGHKRRVVGCGSCVLVFDWAKEKAELAAPPTGGPASKE